MPHLYLDRQREHALFGSLDHNAWQRLNADLYLAGGVLFVAGSVLFFPAFDAWADWGVACFLAGSLLYLVVTGHDLAEVVNSRSGTRTEFLEALAYLAGTVLFTIGSVLFFSAVDAIVAGAVLWLVGSALFVGAACGNILQIVQARTQRALLLMNLTAVSFVVGGILFAVGAIPYFWLADEPGHAMFHGYLAGEFVLGSLLFLAGGVFIRARAVGPRAAPPIEV